STGRVPTRSWLAGLSRAGHHPHASPYLRRDSRPNRPSSGNSPIAKLGWIENENLLAGQYLELANSNFNEVGTHGRNLIPDGSQTSFLNLRLRRDQRSTSEFRIMGVAIITERAMLRAGFLHSPARMATYSKPLN